MRAEFERPWKTHFPMYNARSPLNTTMMGSISYLKSRSLQLMRSNRQMSAFLAVERPEETCLDYCPLGGDESDITKVGSLAVQPPPVLTISHLNGKTSAAASVDVMIAEIYTRQKRWRRLLMIAINLGAFLGNIVFTLAATAAILSRQLSTYSKPESQERKTSWERLATCTVCLLESGCLLGLVAVHLIRYRYWKFDKLYPWRVAIGLGKFSSFEMLKLWNPFYLRHYFDRLRRKMEVKRYSLPAALAFIAIQLLGMLLAIFSPLALYLKVKNVAVSLRYPVITYEFIITIPLFLINFIGFLADRDPLTPWAVLTQRFASDGTIDLDSIQCDQCFVKTVFMEDYYWKRVWDHSLTLLGPEAKWFLLGGLEKAEYLAEQLESSSVSDINRELRHSQSAA